MTSTIPPKDLHILIIGSGITGLVYAQALKKAGIRYSIFEKEETMNYRSNEWTMAIHWALEHLQKLLPTDRWEAMEQASCNPNVHMDTGGLYPIIHAETGNMLAGVPFKRGLRVPRSKMRALCAEGIDVQYGKHLVDVAFNESGEGVHATFGDGTVVSGTMIVGTDGPRSKIREFARGGADKAALSKFEISHINMTVCYGDAEKARFVRRDYPTSYLALSERSHHAFQSISSMPDGEDHPETWIFHMAMAFHGDPVNALSYPDRLALVKARAETMGEPARSAFLWIPENTLVHNADISYWITEPWNNFRGRLTLAGDAAHPMPPYRGQGLNHAICDVSHLMDAIAAIRAGEKSAEQAIGEYDAEIVPRGRDEVTCSVENGKMLHDWEQVRQSPVFNQGFKPMTGHDGKEAVKQAEEEEKIEQAQAVPAPVAVA